MIKDLAYWYNRRKEYEGLLVYEALRATKKTRAFVAKTGRIAKELEICTTEINKLKGANHGDRKCTNEN